jgi:hypothetical protein
MAVGAGNQARDGLSKYNIVPVEPKLKEALERAFQDAQRFGTGTREWCTQCLQSTYRRRIFSACRSCCPHDPVRSVTGYLAKSNGAYLAQRFCLACAHRADIRRGETPTLLDLCFRNNTELYPTDPCARCGATTGTELHHWAPSAIFNDADLWPKSWLCLDCHRIWHQAMRAASGVRLPESERIGESPYGVFA